MKKKPEDIISQLFKSFISAFFQTVLSLLCVCARVFVRVYVWCACLGVKVGEGQHLSIPPWG